MQVAQQARASKGSTMRWRATAAAALSMGMAVLTGCGSSAPKAAAAPAGPPPALPVDVVAARQSDVPLTGEWVGTMDGYVNAQIQPQVTGYLLKQNYVEGSQVSKGQLLFQIDPRPFQAALDMAKGQLAQAQAQLGLSNINVNRDTPLAKAHAIAQSTLDNDTQQQAAGVAAVAAAKASVDNAEINLGFTQVRSIISGVAGQATVQVGNLVGPQAVLTSVSQLNPIKIYFSISDSEYLGLIDRARSAGGSLLHGETKIPLTLELSNGQDYPQKGHIEFIDRQMNAQTGAIRIAAVFPNANNVLRPGQFGRVKAETETIHNATLVPQVAVQELQGNEQVFVVDANNTVHVANLVLGPQVGKDWVIVKSGLPTGARVVTSNLQKLGDGAKVAPHDTTLPDETASGTTVPQGN